MIGGAGKSSVDYALELHAIFNIASAQAVGKLTEVIYAVIKLPEYCKDSK